MIFGNKNSLWGKGNQSIPLPLGDWIVDNSLGILGAQASWGSIAVFEYNNELFAILGNYDGVFVGYKLISDTWVSDSNIVSGLGDVGYGSSPTVFEYNNELYLISGADNGRFYCWKWIVNTWVSDTYIKNGLTLDIGNRTRPEVFFYNSEMYLLSQYNNNQGLAGYKWVIDTWVRDDENISSGLSITDSISTFYIGTDLYALGYNSNIPNTRVMCGKWNGNGWSEANNIATGLNFESTMNNSDAFYYNGKLYLIKGNIGSSFNSYRKQYN